MGLVLLERFALEQGSGAAPPWEAGYEPQLEYPQSVEGGAPELRHAGLM